MNARGDPFKYFRIEARDLIEQLTKGMLEVERGDATRGTVPRLLRLAHTLKGAARVVKQREIADLAHDIETELAPFRDAETAPGGALERALKLVDAIDERVKAIEQPAGSGQQGAARPSQDDASRVLRTDAAELDRLVEGIAEAQAGVTAMRRSLASAGPMRRMAGALASRAERQLTGPDGGGPSPRTREIARDAGDLGALAHGLERAVSGIERIERQLAQVREAGERLRLFPAASLFNGLERTVRDTARALGKAAAFRATGGDVRLDGHVLDALQPALAQLVRNAVAHGIELPDQRSASGKPAEGSVTLAVRRHGTEVEFDCADDGGGVDLAAVRRKLAERGVLTSERSAGETEELLRLLLESGISTSTAITEVSGRGIGLDVVREAVARLAGRVVMRTQPGHGTHVEVVVPVSLASLEALMVDAGESTVALPLSAVRETLRVARSEIVNASDGEALPYRGELVPFVDLSEVIGGDSSARRDPAVSAVIVSGNAGPVALSVDRLLGAVSLLVRALPRLLAADPVVAGAVLDAEGNPQLVLDADRLVARVRQSTRRAPATPPSPPTVLVVDDSLTTRMLEQSILESAGYAVELATSGEQGLEMARRRRYALMLVDVEMPGMDGFTLLEHLRADPELRGTPAILVTSRASPADQRRGAEAGARAYIVKSEFDQTGLLETIRRLVG